MTTHCAGTVQMREESESGIRVRRDMILRRQPKMDRGDSSDLQWKTVPQVSGYNKTLCRQRWTARYIKHPETLMRRNVVIVWLQCLLVNVVPSHTPDHVDICTPKQRSCRQSAQKPSASEAIQTKPISRLVFEIFSFENFYVMTSPLMSRCLDRLSVWIVWTHYAVDDFVKIWSNSDKNCRRRSILKVVTSRLWRHRVTWGHRWRHHLIAPGHFLQAPNSNWPPSSLGFRDIWPQSYGQTHTHARTQTNNQSDIHANWQ